MYRVLCRRVKITLSYKKGHNLCTGFYTEGQNLGSLEKQGTIYTYHGLSIKEKVTLSFEKGHNSYTGFYPERLTIWPSLESKGKIYVQQ